MSLGFPQQLRNALRGWWRDQASERGALGASSLLFAKLREFARDSTPERRRQRYGDMEYDWENRVNTTTGTVGWRARLLGLFHSPYQPTDPALFREMMASLPIAFEQFTFVDLGSGKGRTLLMASEYPFQKIVGVELIEELHRAAEENVRGYHPATQKCPAIDTICGDACDYVFPGTPLLLYLFNPLPETGLRRVLENLKQSLRSNPREAYVLYHNLQLEKCVQSCAWLVRLERTAQFVAFHHAVPTERREPA